MLNISYARARLWIGVSGVGVIVVGCVAGLLFQLPALFLPTSLPGFMVELLWLACMGGLIVALMAPFDFLGGYLAPSRFNNQTVTFSGFLQRWSKGVLIQSLLFLASSTVILLAGRQTGLIGASVSVVVMSALYVALQKRLVAALSCGRSHEDDDKVNGALVHAEEWGFKPLPVTVMHNTDPGFTGGVVGMPGFESIIIPRDSVDQLTSAQLTIILARRLIAVESGARTRGIVLAISWIVAGFILSASLPGAGVANVAELVTTSMGFTIWTFLGLLTLPTVSRQSSYAIDGELLRHGADVETFSETIGALDAVQDDEPSRAALLETIFHPVPSVDNRRRTQQCGSPMAWHAARMTLFLSWSCMGLLARAVHCNVGRPELWAMLPTD